MRSSRAVAALSETCSISDSVGLKSSSIEKARESGTKKTLRKKTANKNKKKEFAVIS
jgi:hypothetical protein